MPVSHYFDHFSPAFTSEQRVYEDLIVESIRIMGHNIWYIPRDSYDSIDSIMGEYVNSKFTRAYKIEMYLANVEGYEGDGEFFSKFGLEIRDTSNFIVSRRSFERYIPSTIAKHPREGDLIYVPVLNKLFEIKYVEEELMFHSIGNRIPYIYELRCEVFRYSNEDIETGVEEIDIIENEEAIAIQVALGNGTGNYMINEKVYQGSNLEYSTASAEIKNWFPSTKKLYLINTKGNFINNTSIVGVTTGANYTVVSVEDQGDYTDHSASDNLALETQAEEFIVNIEKNPFGSI